MMGARAFDSYNSTSSAATAGHASDLGALDPGRDGFRLGQRDFNVETAVNADERDRT